MNNKTDFEIRIFLRGENRQYGVRHWPQVPCVGDQIYTHNITTDGNYTVGILEVELVAWGVNDGSATSFNNMRVAVAVECKWKREPELTNKPPASTGEKS